MKLSKLVFFILPVLAIILTAGIPSPPDCESLFRTSFNKMKKLHTEGLTNAALSYSIRITDSGNKSYVKKMELKVRGKKLAMISDDVSIYQDEAAVVAVQHESKVILITKPAPEQKQKNQFTELLVLQDSVFRLMNVMSCAGDEGSLRKFILQPEQAVKETLGIQAVTYWMDEPSLTMKRVKLDFTSNSQQIKSMEYWVDSLDTSFDGVPFEGKAESLVLANKSLKEKFKEYRLVDNRLR